MIALRMGCTPSEFHDRVLIKEYYQIHALHRKYPWHLDSVERGLSLIAYLVHGFAGGKGDYRWDEFRALVPRRVEPLNVGKALGIATQYGRD